MINLLEFYRTYGESLARRLRVIGHTPATTRFVFVEDMDSAEEVIAAATRTLKLENFVLVWERPTERLSSGGRDNYNTKPQGSLAVIYKPAQDNRETRRQTVDDCRNVALKVMALMLRDETEFDGTLCQAGIRFEFDGQSGEPIPKLAGGWLGYGFAFDWLAPLDLDLSDDELLP